MESSNKKIVNATKIEYKGISFKSKLEVMIFKVIDEAGLNPLYEPEKFVIWRGFKPSVPFYIKDKKTKALKLDTKKQIDITYTPDIIFDYEDYKVIVEVKPQFMNDVYPYKRKLFRHYLEVNNLLANKKPIFAQLATKRETLEFINILKTNYGKKSETT